MTCSAEYQLGDRWTGNKKLLFLLLMLSGCTLSKTDGQIRNLHCFNDYDTEMACTWEAMDLETTCATQYRLIYEREIVPLPHNTCIPENVKTDYFNVPNKCVCTVLVPAFHAGDVYLIQIQSFGKILVNKTISSFDTIKPKTPGNLTVEYNENGDPILHWDKRYLEEETIFKYLTFELLYYNKQDPREKYVVPHHQKESRFEISRSQLTLGGYYVAKIRAKVVGGYDGTWSDYSSEIEFRNDRTNNFVYESIPLIGTLSCLLIIVVIVACYFCICTIKQNCDMIPDPSKSRILLTFVEKSQVSENLLVYGNSSSDSKIWSHLKVTCWSWLGRFAPSFFHQDVVPNSASKTTRRPSSDNPLKTSKPIYLNSLTDPNFLLPEKAFVEPCVILSRPTDIDKTLAEEMNQQDEETQEFDDSNNIFLDPSLNAMFCDMLNMPMCPLEHSVIAIDEYKPCDNLETENALQSKISSDCISSFSFITGTGDEDSCEKTLLTMAQTPASSDFGYQSFESEVGHSEPNPQPDLDHLSCFYGCSETQVDFLTLNKNAAPNKGASEFSSELLGECVDASELNFDSQYRSFSSAILQCEDNLEEDCEYHDTPSSVNCPLICSTAQTQGSITSQQFFNNVVGSDFHCLSHQNANPPGFPLLKFAEDSFLMANCGIHLTEMDILTAGIDSTASFNAAGYQSFENAIRHEKVPEGRNYDAFSSDYATSDLTVGENKEKMPNDMLLFWDNEIKVTEPDGHGLQTSLVQLNTEVGDNTVHWSDSYNKDPGKGMDPKLWDSVFPFVFDKTSFSRQCLAGVQDQKRALGPIMCVDLSFGTNTTSKSDHGIMNFNSDMSHDTLTSNNVDDHLNCSGNANEASPLLENSLNGQISFVSNLSEDTEAALPIKIDFVNILPRESVNGSITPAATQEISTCLEPADDNFSNTPASSKGTSLKYQNQTYFMNAHIPETMLFLEEKQVLTADERKERKIMKMNEAVDVDGNSYMTVTEMNT